MVFDIRFICFNNVLVLNVFRVFNSFVYRYIVINVFFLLINLIGFFVIFVIYMWDFVVLFGFLFVFYYNFLFKDLRFMKNFRREFGKFIYGKLKDFFWK